MKNSNEKTTLLKDSNEKTTLLKGFNFKSISGISYLLWTTVKKQWPFFLFIIIGSISNITTALTTSWDSTINTLFSFSTIVGVLFLTLFSIPMTLSNIHSTTMIKRIGSTRLNERSYILVVFLAYLLIALIYFYINVLIWWIVMLSAGKASLINTSVIYLVYSLFTIILMISVAIFLGTLPIGKVVQVIISFILAIYFMIFSGLIAPLSITLSVVAPILNIVMVLLNPITTSYYILTTIAQFSSTTLITVIGILYTVLTSLIFIALSMKFMSFNKVR